MRKRHSSRIAAFYVLWQKDPLTNLVLIGDGIAVIVCAVVTGEAAVQGSNSGLDFLFLRLHFHYLATLKATLLRFGRIFCPNNSF